MAYAPPSYEEAAHPQLWTIIGPYVRSEDLYSASLVCRQWHSIFSSYLWGNPGSHFGTDNHTVYSSLSRFKRLLSSARLELRSVVHTLHVPPAHPELYDGPQSAWLRDVLDGLPSLQSLIVSNLPFFDHQSLQVVHHSNDVRYPLKLLDPSGCGNTTASSLAASLRLFPELLYLDLSGAQGTRSLAVLSCIENLTNLLVLKLRDCGLRDIDVEHLSFSYELRSLDVSGNCLTETGIKKLFDRLPAGPVYRGETPLSVGRYSGVPLPVRVIHGGVDDFVKKRLTSCVDGYRHIDEGLPSSFSHLYIASNICTIDALCKILGDRQDLQHLDCGSMRLGQSTLDTMMLRSYEPFLRKSSSTSVVDRINPTLFGNAFRNLRSLRIHHSIITATPFSKKVHPLSEHCLEPKSGYDRLEDNPREHFEPEAYSELVAREVNSAPQYSELEAPSLSHALNSSEDIGAADSEILTSSKTGGETLPSMTQSLVIDSKQLNCPSAGTSIEGLLDTVSVATKSSNCSGNDSNVLENLHMGSSKKFKPTSTQDLITEINRQRERIGASERQPGRYKPSALPNLKILTLSDIPSTTRDKSIPGFISLFIQECAEEEELSRLQDLLRAENLKQKSRCVRIPHNLQRLVLEIGPSKVELSSKCGIITKSSTEDPDSELFMRESEQDFSFFKEIGSGSLRLEESKDPSSSPKAHDGLIKLEEEGPMLDVVGELVTFRKERRKRYEAIERRMTTKCEERKDRLEKSLVGHWVGEVKVVRLV